MGFKVPQHWGILGAKISIHDRAKYIIAKYTKHGHRLRILKIRDNTIKIEKLVKRLRND
jgi:hypothetical protein